MSKAKKEPKFTKLYVSWYLWQMALSLPLLLLPLLWVKPRWWVRIEGIVGDKELFPYLRGRPGNPGKHRILGEDGSDLQIVQWYGILYSPPASGGKYFMLSEDGTKKELTDGDIGQIIDILA